MKLLRKVKNVAILLIGMLVGAVLAVPFAILQLVMWPFEKPLRAGEVAAFLRDGIEGTLSDDEIDSFSSMRVADPRLRQILDELSDLPEDWTTQKAVAKLEELLNRAEAIADATSS